MVGPSTAVFYSLPGPWPEEPFTLYRCNLYLASKHKSSGRLEVRPGSPPAKISLRSVWLCVAAGGSRSARWRVPVFVVPVWVWQTDDVTLEEGLNRQVAPQSLDHSILPGLLRSLALVALCLTPWQMQITAPVDRFFFPSTRFMFQMTSLLSILTSSWRLLQYLKTLYTVQDSV